MATASRVAVHTRKAMESADQRIAALEARLDVLCAQLDRMEGLLNEALKAQVIQQAVVPEVPTQASTKKAGAK